MEVDALGPFGIAVAEMVKAGCIVWVPKGGGQVEIINHSRLIYENTQQAAEKIIHVLINDSLQQELRRHLQRQSGKFSIERFVSEVRIVVSEFLRET